VSDAGWIEHPRVLKLRRRSVVLDVIARVADGYSRHRTGRNAALLAYYGFLSVFPLVLSLTAVLGFVLQDNPDLQDRILDSTLSQIPIIGQTISTNPENLRGSTGVLVVGLLLSIWSGMRAFTALQVGLDDVYELDRRQRANFAKTRLQALGGILVLGGAQVLTAITNAVSASAALPRLQDVLLLLGTAAINAGILVYSYRYICSTTPPMREVAPGAILGGIAFSLLQYFGSTVVARSLANASPVYGSVASVIALTFWISLHATIALGAAELNRVLRRP
jgi:YihY family inner membrane protein